ncbi:MAG TPA: trimeric intracellular cation channel family protein [Mycobacteriales bacterium]|nr:trimeric intracellular cation channel family protein [Mycobacteriales bacterium]
MNRTMTLLTLDLIGTFAFAVNGAMTAMRSARLDVVGIVTLGMITALGGGVIRDVLLGSTPPATFQDPRYLAVASVGGLLVFALGHRLLRWAGAITMLDAMGLSLFAVAGATKALEHDVAPAPAVLLGAVTAVGGGVLRDVMLTRVPTVLHSELYAVPALVGAALTVAAAGSGADGAAAAAVAAVTCFVIRIAGARYGVNAPRPTPVADAREVSVTRARRRSRTPQPRSGCDRGARAS